MMTPLAITHFTLTTALGAGNAPNLAALREGRSGLQPCHFLDVTLPGWVGEVGGLDEPALPAALADFDCRNNRLAWLGLQRDGFAEAVARSRERWGAHRVAVLLATSTSGILQTELAYRRRGADGALPADFLYAQTHNTGSLAMFVAQALGLGGPAWVVSTACSSSAKVFAAAQRLIEAGWADAAVVGGVDSLCLTTLYGFSSLELFSPEICRPWDARRSGLSLGEAAAYALLQREASLGSEPAAGWLLGTGESSDGYHMSSPHPEGIGAIAAMRQALDSAGCEAAAVDYINLHGTATPANDAAEGKAVAALFGNTVPCSSTKGATGHTLGAAGAVEAIICALALSDGFLPGSPGTQQLDPAIPVDYLLQGKAATVRHALSNSFGFGGSNCSLILGVAP